MKPTVDQSAIEPEPRQGGDGAWPSGNHPLEAAARRGIGPLSPLARDVWHGYARPCVSCGSLVLRDQRQCDHCGQDLSDEMIERMRAHAGPWHVLEHLHPFPGVSLERVIRQIRRGVLSETSIVRGPATDYQWRFAVETPGLCRYFGRCWKCHANVTASDARCAVCSSDLSFESAHPVAPLAAPLERPSPEAPGSFLRLSSEHLRELSAALDQSSLERERRRRDEPARIGRISASWVAFAAVVLAILALIWMTRGRLGTSAPQAQPPARVMETPAPVVPSVP